MPHEMTARLAHLLHQRRGGDELANWHAAEKLAAKAHLLADLLRLIQACDLAGVACPSPSRHGVDEAAVMMVEAMIRQEIV